MVHVHSLRQVDRLVIFGHPAARVVARTQVPRAQRSPFPVAVDELPVLVVAHQPPILPLEDTAFWVLGHLLSIWLFFPALSACLFVVAAVVMVVLMLRWDS